MKLRIPKDKVPKNKFRKNYSPEIGMTAEKQLEHAYWESDIEIALYIIGYVLLSLFVTWHVWYIGLIMLLPVAIPIYFFLRNRKPKQK